MEILGLGVPDTQQFEPQEAAAHCPSDIPAEPCRRNSCHDVNLWQASWLPEVRSGAINRPKQKPAVTSYLQSKSARPDCTSQSLSLFLSFLSLHSLHSFSLFSPFHLLFLLIIMIILVQMSTAFLQQCNINPSPQSHWVCRDNPHHLSQLCIQIVTVHC